MTIDARILVPCLNAALCMPDARVTDGQRSGSIRMVQGRNLVVTMTGGHTVLSPRHRWWLDLRDQETAKHAATWLRVWGAPELIDMDEHCWAAVRIGEGRPDAGDAALVAEACCAALRNIGRMDDGEAA